MIILHGCISYCIMHAYKIMINTYPSYKLYIYIYIGQMTDHDFICMHAYIIMICGMYIQLIYDGSVYLLVFVSLFNCETENLLEHHVTGYSGTVSFKVVINLSYPQLSSFFWSPMRRIYVLYTCS